MDNRDKRKPLWSGNTAEKQGTCAKFALFEALKRLRWLYGFLALQLLTFWLLNSSVKFPFFPSQLIRGNVIINRTLRFDGEDKGSNANSAIFQYVTQPSYSTSQDLMSSVEKWKITKGF